MAVQYHFNLIERKRSQIIGKLTGFIGKYVRYILIITQLIVLAVFFVKVLYDQQIVDLKEKIDQSNHIITAAEPLMQNNNKLAIKVEAIQQLIKKQQNQYNLVTKTLNNVPQTVQITKFKFINESISIQGTTFRPIDIKKFEARLKKLFPNKEIIIKQIIIDLKKYQFDITINEKETA